MFINPKKAIEEGWLKFPSWMESDFREKCIQPNAVDFTLDVVFNINHRNTFEIGESSKKMRGVSIMTPLPIVAGVDGWAFHEGQMYDCLSDFYVELPVGVCAMLVTRSTFVRNGLFWVSGLYDTGFKGHIGGVLHNRSGPALVAQHTRVGQIIFTTSDSATMYAGGWNHSEGTHYTAAANAGETK